MKNSPDQIVDLGLLFYVFTARRFDGEYEGWTDVPTDLNGKRSHMGFRRIRAGLDRLVAWGIITAMSTNGDRCVAFKRPLNYRYDLRTTSRKVKARAEAKVKAESRVQAEKQQRQEMLKSTPPVHQDKPYVNYWQFFPKLPGLVPMQGEPAVVAQMPKCSKCGKHYHPDLGRSEEEGLCIKCWVDREFAAGRTTLTLMGVDYTYNGTSFKRILSENVKK